MAFNCIGCSYYRSPAMNLKFENNNSSYLLVFQAPGFDEWNGGKSTVSGKRIPLDSNNRYSCAARMRNSFIRKGVSRTNYDIAEAVCCFPGKLKNGRDKKPNVSSRSSCTKNMATLLRKKSYTKITCFGNFAFQTVKDAISMIPGWIGPTPIFASHPSSGVTNKALDSSY